MAQRFKNKADDHLVVTQPLYQYVLDHSLREHPLMKELREETVQIGEDAIMLGAPDEAQFLAMLVKLIGAKKVIEVGVFTGYTTLSLALAMPSDGKIVACDVSEEFTNIGRKYWEKAGVANKITLKLQPATDTLDALLADGEGETYDLAFIDADKVNYAVYYERLLKLIRPNGVIVVDNTLWSGNVLPDSGHDDPSTAAIRALNDKLYTDERVDISFLHIADGVTLLRKK